MESTKIIVRTESSNLWWGVYGLTAKVGWEDLNLFYETGERIGGVCLNTKKYLRESLPDLQSDKNEVNFIEAVEAYLSDNKCHYWFYYDEIDSKDFYEVAYEAPINDTGLKPRFIDIWHPDESIGLKTIENAVSIFAKNFLKIDDCTVEVVDAESIEESVKTFIAYEKLFNRNTPVNIKFADELVSELSVLWKMQREKVIEKLKASV